MTETNRHGSTVERSFVCDGDRYHFDFVLCTPAKGWQQYDTDQDAWYFGVWVNREERKTLCFAEGDITITTSPTEEIFEAELAAMAEFHGSPPPAFVVIDTDSGQVTEHYDEAGAFGRPLPCGATDTHDEFGRERDTAEKSPSIRRAFGHPTEEDPC